MIQGLKLALIVVVHVACTLPVYGEVYVQVSTSSEEFGCHSDVCRGGQYCDDIEARCSPCPCAVCGLEQPVQCQIYCQALKTRYKRSIDTSHVVTSKHKDEEVSILASFAFGVNIVVFFIVSVLLFLNLSVYKWSNRMSNKLTEQKLTSKPPPYASSESHEAKQLASGEYSETFHTDNIAGSSNSLGYTPRYVTKTKQLCQDELVTADTSRAIMETGHSRVVMQTGHNSITCPADNSRGCTVWTMSPTANLDNGSIFRPVAESCIEETIVKSNAY